MREHWDSTRSKTQGPDLRTPMALSWVLECGHSSGRCHPGSRDGLETFPMLDKHCEGQDVLEGGAKLSLKVVHAFGL